MSLTALVTGANVGLGYESCKQLAGEESVAKVILACRNEAKAKDAVASLAKETGKPESLFSIVICDVSDLASCKAAAASVQGKLDRLILNAGGMPANGADIDPNGVTSCFAQNVLGHAVLLEDLIKAGKLSSGARIVFSGSEGAMGLNLGPVNIKKPIFLTQDAEGIESHMTGKPLEGGKPFAQDEDLYASAKGIGALYMASMARKHSKYNFATVSPGMTAGTDVTNKAPFPINYVFKFLFVIFSLIGSAHNVTTGAKRYVDQVMGKWDYPTGAFVASKSGATGEVGEVGKMEAHSMYGDAKLQDAAYEAIHRYIK